MSTTLTPPPVGPSAAPPPGKPRPAAKVVAISTAAFGAAVVVATVLSGVVPAVASASARTEAHSLDAGGVTALDLDLAATEFAVRFGDVDEATLDLRAVTGGAWTFEREGDTLRVEAPRGFLFGWWGSRRGEATLTLPRSLETRSVDIDLDFGAGDATVEGSFGDLVVDLGAGRLTALGSADALTIGIGAGRADIDLEGVTTADLSISAGEMVGRLTGDAPDEVVANVSAGSLDLTLPDAEYDVNSEVSAGDFDNGLRTDTGSSHRVTVEVSAGNARILSD